MNLFQLFGEGHERKSVSFAGEDQLGDGADRGRGTAPSDGLLVRGAAALRRH